MHTAKTLVLVYLCFSVPIVLLALFVAFIRDGAIPGFTVLSALILNAILGFGLLWVACKVYNWVANNFGGIELALKEVPEETDNWPLVEKIPLDQLVQKITSRLRD